MRNSGITNAVNELCIYMKKINIGQTIDIGKIRKLVSLYTVWTKEELEQPLKYSLGFP